MKIPKQKSKSKLSTIVHHLGWPVIIQAVFFFIPLQGIAQGVPKAYEAISYHGTVNGQAATFILANGYIGASSLKLHHPGYKKSIVFEPDQGVGDEKNRLKLITYQKGRLDYFIMSNMQDTYDENPEYIVGNYYLNHRVFLVKFWLIKHSGDKH